MTTISTADASRVLNLAADLFAASPRQTFSRDEVVNLLRLLPDELANESARMELEAHLAEVEPS